MFSLFRSQPFTDHLESAKQKLRKLVATHLRTLALKRRDGITIDAYGTVDGSKWIKETQYFVDKVWSPLLTIEEKKAVLNAGLSSVGQELIEIPVRDECARMHAEGEHDMEIRVVHPPDMTGTGRQGGKASGANAISLRGGACTRGLIIRPEPLEKILFGEKTWEMRSDHTKIRGKIALIRKGSKTIYGTAEIIDSKGPLSASELLGSVHFHGITPARLATPEVQDYKYAWVLANVKRLASPIPYHHRGGVIFVTLDEYAVQALAVQSGEA